MWARQIKQKGAWLRAGWPGFDPWCRRGGDFIHSFVSRLVLGVHSTSYKMSTGLSPEVKAAERRTSHPNSSQCRGCEYVTPCIHILHRHSWPAMGIPLLNVRQCGNHFLKSITTPEDGFNFRLILEQYQSLNKRHSFEAHQFIGVFCVLYKNFP